MRDIPRLRRLLESAERAAELARVESVQAALALGLVMQIEDPDGETVAQLLADGADMTKGHPAIPQWIKACRAAASASARFASARRNRDQVADALERSLTGAAAADEHRSGFPVGSPEGVTP